MVMAQLDKDDLAQITKTTSSLERLVEVAKNLHILATDIMGAVTTKFGK